MTQLPTDTSPLVDTDLFLVQRPSVSSTGLASSPNFSVTARQISLFAATSLDTDLEEIKTGFDELWVKVDFIQNTLLVELDSTVIEHHYRLLSLEDETQKLGVQVEKHAKEIKNTLNKTKIFLYHRLVKQAEQTYDPGEMVLLGENDVEAENFADVRKIQYNLEQDQQISNLFIDETLELTCQRGPDDADIDKGAHLGWRAIYKLDDINYDESALGRITLEVTPRNVSGVGLPYYSVGLANEVRTDVYPIFTVSEEELDAKLDLCYKKAGGPVDGNITIGDADSQNSTLFLKSSLYNEISFVNNLRFKNSGYLFMEFVSGQIKLHKKVDCGTNKLFNLPTPTDDGDAATMGWVNSLIAENDISSEDLFKPGDPVALAGAGSSAKNLGFFYTNGALYFKVN